MSRPGIQVIIYGQRNRDDIGGVLREVAALGYAGAETGNLFRQEGDPDAVRALFQETGLALCGCHAGYGEFQDGERLAENLAFLQAMDSRYLMCSGVGDRSRGLAAYREASRVFNEVGKRCRDAGVAFCYHNHAWEFEDREGDTCGMDVLAAETDPALVKFCLDVYWIYHGQDDPVRFIQAHADRAVYFHFKDGVRAADGRAQFRELGCGEVDLKAAFAAASALQPAWIVYEQDRTDRTPTESSRVSREYLRSLGI
ncbi:MAG: TIM barrel protein [Armatimonadetes bacterium]|nr:TIM barrel protein [Armatimonadota bacterium]